MRYVDQFVADEEVNLRAPNFEEMDRRRKKIKTSKEVGTNNQTREIVADEQQSLMHEYV